MTCPDLSVVMAVCNGAPALKESIHSILVQSVGSLELVVVDDGSTDGTGALLDELATRDGRVKIIHQQNLGLTRSLIRGCEAASGEFIARQDCGDISLPGRFESQLQAIQSDETVSFISCWTRYATVEGEELYVSRGNRRTIGATDILDLSAQYGVIDGPTHHGSVMFRRSTYLKVGGYRSEFYFGQDWDLWYRLAEVGRFQMLEEALYEARIGVADISVNNKDKQTAIGRESLRALKLRRAGLSDEDALLAASLIRPNRGDGTHPRNSVWRGCYFIGECLRRNGNRSAAQAYLRRAIKDNPLHVKSWARLIQALVG